MTAGNSTLTLTMCVNYGGRAEIADAARAVAREVAAGRLDPEKVDERVLAGAIAVAAVVVLCVALAPVDVPFTALMVPLLVGSLLLSPREMPWFLAWMSLMLALSVALQPDKTARIIGASGIQVLMILIVLAVSVRRSRLGVGGMLGESMFVDLRDRLLDQGRVPALPHGWTVESALRSAGAERAAGSRRN